MKRRRHSSKRHRLFVSFGVFSAFVNLPILTAPVFVQQVYDRVLTSRSEATPVALVGMVGLGRGRRPGNPVRP